MLAHTLSRRRILSGTIATLAFHFLPGCESNERQKIDPKQILNDLRENKTIQELRKGEITFSYKEPFSPNGKETLKLIQKGLYCLGLIKTDPNEFEGIYGNETVRAVRYLQAWARIEGDNGRTFNKDSLAALEKALEAKIDGRWRPPVF